MGGIIGYAGGRSALNILASGLKRLKSREDDSSGMALPGRTGLKEVKGEGDRPEARRSRAKSGLAGVGRRTVQPLLSCDRRIAVVHDGVVENAAELRRGLEGHRFAFATTEEVVAHLIEDFYRRQNSTHPLRAVTRALEKIRGRFALGVIFADYPDLLIATRVRCPLVLGVGRGENYLASDVAALVPHTRRVLPLEENEVAKIDRKGISIYDRDYNKIRRKPRTVSGRKAPG